MVMHALKLSLSIWDKVKTKFDINHFNSKIEFALYNIMSNLSEADFTINEETFQNSVDLSDFFLKHHLVLSGYSIDIEENIDKTIEKILNI